MSRVAASVAVVIAFSIGLFNPLQSMQLGTSEAIALAILVIAATLWVTEAVPLFVTSLVILFLSIVWLLPNMQLENEAVSKDLFLSPFFSDIILLFLGGFVLSAAMHKHRLDEWLAAKIIAATNGSPGRLLFGIMFVTAALSMWLSNTATAAMMMALVLPLASSLPETDRFRKGLLLGIPFAANIGGLGTPIGSPPNAIAMQYMASEGIGPNFGTWMLIGIPGTLSMLLLAWGLLRVLFPAQLKELPSQTEQIELRVNWQLQLVLVVVAVTVLGWVTSSLHGLSSGTIALIPLLVLFGSRVLNAKEIRGLSWDVLILMGGGLCLGVVISESGLATWLTGRLPVDGLSPYGVMLVFGVAACIMSSVMSNTATANLVMPILLGLSIEPVSPLLVGVAFACSLAMPLPVSTPPNAMAFSSDQLTVSDMVKPGLILTIIGVALAFTVGYAWWMVVGI